MKFRDLIGEANSELVNKLRSGVKAIFDQEKKRGLSDKQAWDRASSTKDGSYLGNKELAKLKKELLNESEMKFQALSMAKDLHNKLAGLTFIDMLAVMSPENPAKKEVQALETAINALTTEVGDFIQKYIPDVADAEAGAEDMEAPEEEEEDNGDTTNDKTKEQSGDEKSKKTSKSKEAKIKDNEEEIEEEK